VKRSALPVAAAIALFSGSAPAGVTVRYFNRDSEKHELPARCSCVNKTIVFSAKTTSSYTIQGSGPCVVSSPQGDVTLLGGESLEIKDGKIVVK
jgi:hypothetical protein